ncbi:MAG: butyrate kinase [Clostridiaceae bacterium]
MQVLVINPGATSTKVSVFDEENEVLKANVAHSAESLAGFSSIVEQAPYRRALIEAALKENGYALSGFDAVCGRGGLLRHIPSGTYRVTDKVIHDVYNPPFGQHASNLGSLLAKELADEAGIPAFFVDPVSVDEMTDVARVSGFCGMERQSFFHALNQKSTARRAASSLGKAYEELNLIVVHMGGGVSVAAHERGRVVDVYNVRDEGSFAMDRGGSLPTNAVIDFCFSGIGKAEAKTTLESKSGVYSYLGTRDFKEVIARANAGDERAKLIFDAMIYQHAKDIGAMAAVLKMDVDAIVLTGGIAYGESVCKAIESYVGKIAPVLVFAGEEEMRSLALGALRALRGGPVGEY